MKIKLLEATGPEDVVVDAARVSYDGKGRKSTDGENLMRHKHMTPFEMLTVRVYVEAPIFVIRQWQRHRTFCLSGDTRIKFARPWEGEKREVKDANIIPKAR